MANSSLPSRSRCVVLVRFLLQPDGRRQPRPGSTSTQAGHAHRDAVAGARLGALGGPPGRCPQGHAAELDAAAGFPAGAEWAGVGHPAQRAWGRVLEGFHRRGPRGRGPVAAGVTLGEAPLPGFAFAFGLKWHRLCLRASMAPQGSRGARTAPVLRPFGRVERCRWIASWGKLGWRWALGLGRRRQPRDAGQRATLVPLYGPRLS